MSDFSAKLLQIFSKMQFYLRHVWTQRYYNIPDNYTVYCLWYILILYIIMHLILSQSNKLVFCILIYVFIRNYSFAFCRKIQGQHEQLDKEYRIHAAGVLLCNSRGSGKVRTAQTLLLFLFLLTILRRQMIFSIIVRRIIVFRETRTLSFVDIWRSSFAPWIWSTVSSR